MWKTFYNCFKLWPTNAKLLALNILMLLILIAVVLYNRSPAQNAYDQSQQNAEKLDQILRIIGQK